MSATAWTMTDLEEPRDGMAIEWPEGGRIVRGYRMGRLWVEPARYTDDCGPRYWARPDRWRLAPAGTFKPWVGDSR